MENKVEKLLDMLIDALEKGGDLIGENAPKFFTEILEYEYMYSAIFSCFFGFLFLLFLGMTVYFIIAVIKRGDKAEHSLPLVGYSMGLLIIGMIIQAHVKDVIKIKMAPRVYTIEYLRDFKTGRNR
jgi:hypothetical protein